MNYENDSLMFQWKRFFLFYNCIFLGLGPKLFCAHSNCYQVVMCLFFILALRLKSSLFKWKWVLKTVSSSIENIEPLRSCKKSVSDRESERTKDLYNISVMEWQIV